VIWSPSQCQISVHHCNPVSCTPLTSRGEILNRDRGKASLDAEDKTEAVEIRAAKGKLKVALWHPIAFHPWKTLLLNTTPASLGAVNAP